MSQNQIDAVKRYINDTVDWLRKGSADAERAFNDGVDSASKKSRESLNYGINQFGIAKTQAEDAAATAQAHYQNAEEQILSVVRTYIKQGISYAQDYPYAAYGVAGCTLLLFPQPRAFLFRNVFGALQSQESAMRGASERYASLSETASNHLKAQQSNAEAASTALAELTAARTAAKDTHKKLSALSANMNKALRNFEDLQAQLRTIKHDDVTALRGDVANEKASLQKGYKEVNKMLGQLTSAGV